MIQSCWMVKEYRKAMLIFMFAADERRSTLKK